MNPKNSGKAVPRDTAGQKKLNVKESLGDFDGNSRDQVQHHGTTKRALYTRSKTDQPALTKPSLSNTRSENKLLISILPSERESSVKIRTTLHEQTD